MEQIKILIIDDYAEHIKILTSFANSFGIKYTTATNVDDAKFICDDAKFDYAIVDLEMPGKSGFEFIQHHPDIKCIILTATSEYNFDYGIFGILPNVVGLYFKPLKNYNKFFEDLKSGNIQREVKELRKDNNDFILNGINAISNDIKIIKDTLHEHSGQLEKMENIEVVNGTTKTLSLVEISKDNWETLSELRAEKRYKNSDKYKNLKKFWYWLAGISLPIIFTMIFGLLIKIANNQNDIMIEITSIKQVNTLQQKDIDKVLDIHLIK